MNTLQSAVAAALGAQPKNIQRSAILEGMLMSVGQWHPTLTTILAVVTSDTGARYTCCLQDRDQARDLARHLFRHVRVTGLADWTQDARGDWSMSLLLIQAYERI